MSDADKPESLDFDFAPAWAKESSDKYVSRYQGKNYDERTGREERPRRDGFRDRPPRRDSGRPPRRGEERTGERRALRREGGDAPAREPHSERARRPFMRREPAVKPLDAEIRILPNQKTLGSIMKTLQGTHLAFPVKKFVTMFLDNPQACLVRFEAKPETEVKFWTCKVCGQVALSEGEIVQHILAMHMGEFFDVSEEPCEPPSGVFPRVAKCTLTGEWVGAPNHHSYKRRVAELAARAGMSERDYLQTLEMHTDAESVEAWKQSVTTQTVYRRKAAPAAEPATAPESETPKEEAVPEGEPKQDVDERPVYNRDQAEAIVRQELMPTLIAAVKHICLPVALAQQSPSLPLRLLLKYTLRDEQRYPRSLFFALRGAFRHRKFTVFRGNDARGPEFVANITLTPFTAEHVVPELAAALRFVSEHPLCTRAELLVALQGEFPDLEPAVLARQIAFLFQKGHIVEYYNGVLALPEENPKFRKLPEEMKRERELAGVEEEKPQEPVAKKKAEEEQKAEAAPAPEAGAPAETKPEAIQEEVPHDAE